MIKSKFIKILVYTLLSGLISVMVLSACGTKEAHTQENIISQTEEAEAQEDDPPEEEEAEAIEELDPGEEAEGDTSQPAQVMDISPAEVFRIMEDDEDYLILDVRTQEEYDGGHLEGAMLLPVQELEDRMGGLPGDKPIIVYCRSGGRSRRAAEMLVENGFTRVYDMGGISSWEAEGYSVITEE